jgi:hypothetical protein
MNDVQKRDGKKDRPSTRMLIVSAGLVAVILVNAYIIWYFLIGMPSACAARAIATAGRETCGTGQAVPVIVAISATLIAASLYLIFRWHIQKKGI